MMTDPIADMLTRIRNAGSAGHKWADMPVSKLKTKVADLLKDNHFIYDFKVLDDGRFGADALGGTSLFPGLSWSKGPFGLCIEED